MLLNPVDKKAKRDSSTQTALQLNLQATLDYTPFSPIMAGRAQLNPLLVMLNSFRHAPVNPASTMFAGEVGSQLERGVLYHFLHSAIE